MGYSGGLYGCGTHTVVVAISLELSNTLVIWGLWECSGGLYGCGTHTEGSGHFFRVI